MKFLSCLPIATALYSPRPADQALIGAWNLDKWTNAKIQDSHSEQIHYEVFGRYDILQVSGVLEDSVDDFISLVESFNSLATEKYAVAMCEPTGQFPIDVEVAGFIYKPDLFDVTTFLYDDNKPTAPTFVRYPCIAQVESALFDEPVFLVGTAAEADRAVIELNALDAVYENIRSVKDSISVMFLGNMYADCNYVSNWDDVEIFNNPVYTWWIEDGADTMVSSANCAFDRIISTEILGDRIISQVYDFQFDIGIEREAALAVSLPCS